MRVHRLTAVAHVFHYWDFISEALASISDAVREPWDKDFVQKTMVNLVVDQEHVWIGVTIDPLGVPLAFGVVQECTPEFDSVRYFVVRWFYHSPTKFEATLALRDAFETWAKAHGIKRYAVTTRRSAGRAIQCFQSSRYGFKKAFLTFEKDL